MIHSAHPSRTELKELLVNAVVSRQTECLEQIASRTTGRVHRGRCYHHCTDDEPDALHLDRWSTCSGVHADDIYTVLDRQLPRPDLDWSLHPDRRVRSRVFGWYWNSRRRHLQKRLYRAARHVDADPVVLPIGRTVEDTNRRLRDAPVFAPVPFKRLGELDRTGYGSKHRWWREITEPFQPADDGPAGDAAAAFATTVVRDGGLEFGRPLMRQLMQRVFPATDGRPVPDPVDVAEANWDPAGLRNFECSADDVIAYLHRVYVETQERLELLGLDTLMLHRGIHIPHSVMSDSDGAAVEWLNEVMDQGEREGTAHWKHDSSHFRIAEGHVHGVAPLVSSIDGWTTSYDYAAHWASYSGVEVVMSAEIDRSAIVWWSRGENELLVLGGTGEVTVTILGS